MQLFITESSKMKGAKTIRVKHEMKYRCLGTECKSWMLSKILVMFLIVSTLMICAAQKVYIEENNTLVVIGACGRNNYEFLCRLIPGYQLKGMSRVKLLNVNAETLSSYMFRYDEVGVYEPVTNQSFLELLEYITDWYDLKYENNTDEYDLNYENNTDEYDYDYENNTNDYDYENKTYDYEYSFTDERIDYLENITYLEISNVKSLEYPYSNIWKIFALAFEGFKNLEELHIHLDTLSSIDPDTFDGLNVLKTLNLNGCKRLDTDLIMPALKPLPLLENLFLSGPGSISWTNLTSKRYLRKLDISLRSINIRQLSLAKCNTSNLEYLNMSSTYIEELSFYKFWKGIYKFLPRVFYHWLSECIHLTHLDIGHSEVRGRITITNIQLKVLNISGIFKTNSKLNITRREYTSLSTDKRSIQLLCRNQSVEVVELAENALEDIAPDALACFKNAKTINLSKNKLFVMMERHADLFELLFRYLDHLENIRLSSNELTEIPSSLFDSNKNLRRIDLSSNKLQTINLSLNHLNHLVVLDLENNRIIVLDGASINVIEKLSKGSAVNLNSNPLECSRCADLDFVRWLAKSKELKREGLTCVGSKNYTTVVDDALVFVQTMCDEEMKTRMAAANMRLAVSIPIAFLAFLSIIILMVYFTKRQIRKIRRQREVEEIKLTMKNNERFAVFLTYCSEDDAFVHQYVVDNLNQNLKLVIGTDRNLVCEGDRHFRLGKPILDEISELLDRSDVLVAVVSNKYCLSVFCRNEFQQAVYKEMPILLMLQENIDLENMSPSMRDMFEKKTRVLWECEDGEYKLKTTWLNVCESVVELIDINKIRLHI